MQDLTNSVDRTPGQPNTLYSKETKEEIRARRTFEIEEAKHEIVIKKIFNGASASYLLLNLIIFLGIVLVAYGIIIDAGPIEIGGMVAALLLGGSSPALIYRYQSKRTTPWYKKDKTPEESVSDNSSINFVDSEENV